MTTPFDAELSFKPEEEQEIYRLKQENKLDEVFRLLFIKQCNALNEILPALFEKTSDYTELLLNLSVIDQDGVVYHLVHDIPEADFNIEQGGQVEIIGWLYQYYNTEPKDETFLLLKRNVKITKDRIPAATQLFTPDWIVRYMVENSVGRIWIEHLRALDETKDEVALAADFGWKYYLPEAKQEPEVEEKLRELRKERAALTPEQITMIDPCMGSGHILVYGFSVLMQIYESAGYGQRDAAKSILDHNLFGLDIDDRAYQMAYFAVMMKAREYNRRILNGENTCKAYAIQESNGITDAALGDMGGGLSEDERKKALKEIKALIAEFKDAKEYGSILNIEKRDLDLLRRFAVPNVGVGQLTLDMNGAEPAANRLQEIIDIAEVMADKYLTSITNPPYMGTKGMNANLSTYLKDQYSSSKSDLYSAFIAKLQNLSLLGGYISMITQRTWLFIGAFEELRRMILGNTTSTSYVELGAGAFEDLAGEVVQSVVFTLCNGSSKDYKSVYVDLSGVENKEDAFHSFDRKAVDVGKFEDIPNHTFAMKLSEKALNAYSNPTLVGSVAVPKKGLISSDNNRFLKLWQEVSIAQIQFGLNNIGEQDDQKKWVPHNKGGSYRKWYGNQEYVINWKDDGKEVKAYAAELYGSYSRQIMNEKFYFRSCLSWSSISSQKIGVRYYPIGFTFDTAGPSLFITSENERNAIFGLLASKVAEYYIRATNPTINLLASDISNLPLLLYDDATALRVKDIVESCVNAAKEDWNSMETSWDFAMHPIVRKAFSRFHWNNAGDITLECVYQYVAQDFEDRFQQLKTHEEELNRIFIDIYGLQDELTPEVEDKDVTVRRADLQRDIKSLLSYAVGCMFGRYSLSTEGLTYAGGTWDASKYFTFLPDEDNVIPITDEEYLEDDIVSRLCTWLKVVFGESTLEANLDFIAKALGNKGDSSREVIRNYFLKEHCQTYSVTGSGKRPIYWLFDSGKQNGFKALIYLHRYNADTIGNLRIDYLHRMQRIYESEISRMQDMVDHSTNAREVAGATKRREKLQKQLKECREYDEKLAHLALSRIELDLDDGVKANYRKIQTASDGKFYEVLADSKNIMAKK